jgi:FixJ family two-component response regulator
MDLASSVSGLFKWRQWLLNKQIGAELGTSETTVKIHRHHVMEKMGAGALSELVRMADRLGILVPKS